MDIHEALRILDACDWLKMNDRHVTASKHKTRDELRMLDASQLTNPSAWSHADVLIRRKKNETLEALIIRAAELVKAGHVPTVRVPPLTYKDQCKCGAQSHNLVWNQQLQQRLCRRCEAAWQTAAKNNDIRQPTTEWPQ